MYLNKDKKEKRFNKSIFLEYSLIALHESK